MDTYDPDQLHRKLEAIEARMACHERTTRIILVLVIALAVVALGLLLDHLVNRQ
ncbi:hypothetical protein [Microvirga aerophila]|uniref:Uncharacterized protein n=1 Tax=Microvirga aerophila TaxID=670291 RepID=A0A512C1U5_9HYPH|nr:hypothetical protein [Microvirga aerophila]GEO18190.1 hypothetical protein MAE02_58860 [Microvirga aerophila]